MKLVIRVAPVGLAWLYGDRHQVAETGGVGLLLSYRIADQSQKDPGDHWEGRSAVPAHLGAGSPLDHDHVIVATAVAPTAPRITTSQGGTATGSTSCVMPPADSAGAANWAISTEPSFARSGQFWLARLRGETALPERRNAAG
jgi:hypothetical protein